MIKIKRSQSPAAPTENVLHAQDPRGGQLPLDQQAGHSAGSVEPDYWPQRQWQIQSLPRTAPVGGNGSGWRGRTVASTGTSPLRMRRVMVSGPAQKVE